MASWAATKRQVWERAAGQCERCRNAPGHHVHHLRYLPHKRTAKGKYVRQRGGEPLEWLQLLCLGCHTVHHPHHCFRPIEEQRHVADLRRHGLPTPFANPVPPNVDWSFREQLLARLRGETL